MKPGDLLLRLALAALAAAMGSPVAAAPPEAADEEAAAEPAPAIFDHLLVTGGAQGVGKVPGSATYLGREQLEPQGHDDLHRVLAQVPGVYVQEEDGYGLRPNIGMRGTGVERSQKITLLEDGVLIAPAPYSAPAAYYAPVAWRMEAVEVRKGSAAVRQGPFTQGGVINLISTAIPDRLAGRLAVEVGGDATRRLRGHVGGSRPRFGWLVEALHFETGGFKRLDGGGPTGVDLGDYLAKARWNSASEARVYQSLELKLGHTEQRGHETYLGLSEGDFARAPFRRYAASGEDRLDADHGQAQLRWLSQLGPRVQLSATLYRNDFARNWYKLQSVAGTGLAAVLADPGSHGGELALLTGEADAAAGKLALRNNRRSYLSRGVQLIADWHLRTAGADHRLQAGLRLHEDEEDRFQEEDLWSLAGTQMRLFARGLPGSQANRIDGARAHALYLSDDIAFGRWTISPGLRFEEVDYERRDFGRADPARGGSDLATAGNRASAVIPGLGVSWRLSSRATLFGGLHRGFAPPGPGRSAETRAEASWNGELGLRVRRGALAAHAVGFWSDYDNLLGRDTLSAGGEGTGDLFNGGKVTVRGLEATAELHARRGAALSFPLRASYTWTRARFDSSFETSFADWAPRVENGDELPYLPKHQVWVAAGALGRRGSLDLTAGWTAESRAHPGQGPIPAAESIGARLLVDLAARWRVARSLELSLKVRNLTDEVYVAARRPAGLRPGLPRTLLAGLTWTP